MNVEVILDKSLKSRDHALWLLSIAAEKLNIIEQGSKEEIYRAFIHREDETTTGLEDGFAIPHALSNKITKSAIIYLRVSEGLDWKALDGKDSRYIMALFIPQKERSSSQVEVLSKIAIALLDNDFKNLLVDSKDRQQIKEAILNRIEEKPKTETKVETSVLPNHQALNVLALTACPVGVAHTYIAAEKIENAIKELGHNVKVETHGSVGPKNVFSQAEIEQADYIVIASDIGLDMSRFANKKVYYANTKEAIKDPKGLVDKAFKEAKVIASENKNQSQNTGSSEKKSYVVKHLLAGVSYLIPFIIFGGLLIAIALGLANALYGSSATPEGTFIYYIFQAGVIAFNVMIGVLGAYIAHSIGGRAAIAPAMIVSLVANNASLLFPITGTAVTTPMGFIGAILFGILIGYSTKWVNSWTINKNVSALVPIFIIPVLVTLFYAFLAIFVIGAPIGYVMDQISILLRGAFEGSASSAIATRVGVGIGLGLVLGAMIGFDMGGPINKIAFVLSVALLNQNIQNPMGIVAAAIPIAPIGMGIASQVYRKSFDANQRGLGISAIIMGFVGISEGAIPFAVADPKRVFPANIIGSAVAGAIAGALGVTSAVGHGGPWIGIVGGISGNFIGVGNSGLQFGLGILFFFIAIIAGSATTVLVYGLLLKVLKTKEVKVSETKVSKMASFTTWKHSVRVKMANSKVNLTMKKHKKLVAFNFFMVLGVITLIIGIVLLALNFSAVIEAFQNNINDATTATSITKTNWGQSNIYGLFLLFFGILNLIFGFIYSFTAFNYRIGKKAVKQVQQV
ncbi:fructose-specific PTS transporter subunit EIIC [Mycoplasmopsis agassizii]|uniref:PTS fructose transporter subunit IIABC n=1 Tax=Mycoplasmopsis agassizii TaxID=33922 RepID=UPI003529B1C8